MNNITIINGRYYRQNANGTLEEIDQATAEAAGFGGTGGSQGGTQVGADIYDPNAGISQTSLARQSEALVGNRGRATPVSNSPPPGSQNFDPTQPGYINTNDPNWQPYTPNPHPYTGPIFGAGGGRWGWNPMFPQQGNTYDQYGNWVGGAGAPRRV